jgi:hypothetical protein
VTSVSLTLGWLVMAGSEAGQSQSRLNGEPARKLATTRATCTRPHKEQARRSRGGALDMPTQQRMLIPEFAKVSEVAGEKS